jgi:hypothetical protein
VTAPARPLDVPVTGEHKVPAPPRGLASLDLPVVIVALALLAGGWQLHRAMTRPTLARFSHSGLAFHYPSDLGLREPMLLAAKAPLVVTFRKAGDARTRIEVRVEPRQLTLGNVAAGLELERANRFGPVYNRLETGRRTLGGHAWLRTRFSYVDAAPSSGQDPASVATYAVEYAWPPDTSVAGDVRYVVTIHGSEAGAAGLESIVSRSLIVP